MVVARCACDRQREKASSRRIDTIVLHLGTQRIKSRAGRLPDLIARDLRTDELVVGHVVIQSLNYPVPVAPGIRISLVFGGEKAIVGVTSHVEPVSRPSLAIPGRSQ